MGTFPRSVPSRDVSRRCPHFLLNNESLKNKKILVKIIMKKKNHHRGKRFLTGFTLVELLVTTSIILIITSVSLVGYSNFGDVTELKNAAYEISVSILKTRTYGMGSVGSSGGLYEKPFGIHFDMSTPNKYIIFVDLDEDKLYTEASENVKIVSINEKFKIKKICGVSVVGGRECSPTTISNLDIVFKRPLPEVFINGGSYKEGEIYLTSDGSNESVIEVNLTGRITVN